MIGSCRASAHVFQEAVGMAALLAFLRGDTQVPWPLCEHRHEDSTLFAQ